MHVISKSWHDVDPSASLGVGLSRSGDPRAPLWAMAVTFPSNEPTVKGSIKATSNKEARRFLRNRYPAALVITVGEKIKT